MYYIQSFCFWCQENYVEDAESLLEFLESLQSCNKTKFFFFPFLNCKFGALHFLNVDEYNVTIPKTY